MSFVVIFIIILQFLFIILIKNIYTFEISYFENCDGVTVWWPVLEALYGQWCFLPVSEERENSNCTQINSLCYLPATEERREKQQLFRINSLCSWVQRLIMLKILWTMITEYIYTRLNCDPTLDWIVIIHYELLWST